MQHKFRVALDEGWYDLELIEVIETDTAVTTGHRRQFSLIFRHERVDVYLPQAIYHLHHENMGELDLFIVRLGPDVDGMRYQVVFA